MSFKALSWAFEQEITQTSPQSHVFLAVANYANEHDFTYPSIKTIAKKTRLNDKTVRKSLQELCDFGLLIDTENVSQFGSKVYKICYQDDIDNSQNLDTPPTKNGSTTKITPPTKNGSTPLPNLPLPPTKNGSTPLPNLGDKPVSKPIREPVSNTVSNTRTRKTKESGLKIQDLMNLKLSNFGFSNDDFEKYPNLGDWIFENMDYQIVSDFFVIRNNSLTMTALKMIVKQASIAKLTLCQALEVCVTTGKGWQTFKAEWYFNNLNKQNQNHYQPQQQQTKRVDYASKYFGVNPQDQRNVINVTPTGDFE